MNASWRDANNMIKNNISVSNAEVTEAINFYKSEIVKQLSKDLNSDKGQAVFAILFNGYCPVNEIALFLIKRVNGSKKRLLCAIIIYIIYYIH